MAESRPDLEEIIKDAKREIGELLQEVEHGVRDKRALVTGLKQLQGQVENIEVHVHERKPPKPPRDPHIPPRKP
ncbi:MAG TPA: hypothetical protein VMF64_08655 [Steroidobacteraceae bacterium]|nr:hypothetical protein [Steroidobacteraceae bacterium]